jgi:3-dehydroquinate synthase
LTPSWSPLHELVPEVPLRHGHAISIDMAYSATLAHARGDLPEADYTRLLKLFSRAGLSMDHPDFNEDILAQATAAILKTRDGKLRAAIPAPLGSCKFLNDVTEKEMNDALKKHKEICQTFPRKGLGLEAFVDASDTGYTKNATPVEKKLSNGLKKLNVLNDDVQNDNVNGFSAEKAKGMANGALNGSTNGVNGKTNGVNGHSNGDQSHDCC